MSRCIPRINIVIHGCHRDVYSVRHPGLRGSSQTESSLSRASLGWTVSSDGWTPSACLCLASHRRSPFGARRWGQSPHCGSVTWVTSRLGNARRDPCGPPNPCFAILGDGVRAGAALWTSLPHFASLHGSQYNIQLAKIEPHERYLISW